MIFVLQEHLGKTHITFAQHAIILVKIAQLMVRLDVVHATQPI
jgi:hypothetical protein